MDAMKDFIGTDKPGVPVGGWQAPVSASLHHLNPAAARVYEDTIL